MKIVFFGRELIAQGLDQCVEKEDIKIVHNPDLSSVLLLIGQNEFDLVIVDGKIPEAESICKTIGQRDAVPIILRVDHNDKAWKTYCTIPADGFITEDASELEILARIKAVCRRSQQEKLRTY
jgi:DNA-binding response OmpR family regulator